MTEIEFDTVIIKEEVTKVEFLEEDEGNNEQITIKQENITIEADPYEYVPDHGMGYEPNTSGTNDSAGTCEARPLITQLPLYLQSHLFGQHFITTNPEPADPLPKRNKRKSVPRKVLREPEYPSKDEISQTSSESEDTPIEAPESQSADDQSTKVAVKRRRKRYEKIYECESCDKKYSIKAKLIIHKRVHTGERPFGCSKCTKRFRTRGTAISHEQSHLGLKPHSCELCEKSYTTKQQLTIHFRTHTGERPFVCKICQKDFKDNWKLTLHSQTHTGLKPFECDKCDKKYTTKYQLTTHYRIHTKDKLFECEICTRQFVEKCKLEKHKGVHLGLKPYICDLCDKKYRQKSHLKYHMESTHLTVKPKPVVKRRRNKL